MNIDYSIIVPSYNQPAYIGKTLANLKKLKEEASERGISIEILLFDSESGPDTQKIIEEYKGIIDYLEVKKDRGQYDAINKGIQKVQGKYWTWLNTDDYIDLKGFFTLDQELKKDDTIDYIYGDIDIIDENDRLIRRSVCWPLSTDLLVNKEASIFQPGSFFKTGKTKEIGLLRENNCCFDYEYILRLLKHDAKFKNINVPVSQFRLYSNSKSGSIVPQFIQEQLVISRQYGRKTTSYLSFFLNLRKMKHKVFNLFKK
jgi:glycosyltransferase involved in cell wall biosynthesis